MLSLILGLMLPAVAQASVVYRYVGNNFSAIVDETPLAGAFTTTDHLTIEFELADS